MWRSDMVVSGTRSNTWSRSRSGFTGDRLSDNTEVFVIAEIPKSEAAFKTPDGKGLGAFPHTRQIPVLASSLSSNCTKKSSLLAV